MGTSSYDFERKSKWSAEECANCKKSLVGRKIAWHSTGTLAHHKYEYCSYRCKVRHAKQLLGYS